MKKLITILSIGAAILFSGCANNKIAFPADKIKPFYGEIELNKTKDIVFLKSNTNLDMTTLKKGSIKIHMDFDIAVKKKENITNFIGQLNTTGNNKSETIDFDFEQECINGVVTSIDIKSSSKEIEEEVLESFESGFSNELVCNQNKKIKMGDIILSITTGKEIFSKLGITKELRFDYIIKGVATIEGKDTLVSELKYDDTILLDMKKGISMKITANGYLLKTIPFTNIFKIKSRLIIDIIAKNRNMISVAAKLEGEAR